MHFTKPFLVEEAAQIRQLITQIGSHAMASIISTAPEGKPVSSYLPVDFTPADGDAIGSVILHLANANEQLATFTADGWVLVEFKSPDLYISPSWFADRNRAPTNVHIIVQCYGRPRIITDIAEKRTMLDAQVAKREATLPAKWSPTELQDNGYERRLAAISLVQIPITSARASVRMLQDESVENIRSVLEYLKTSPQHANIITMIEQANADRIR